MNKKNLNTNTNPTRKLKKTQTNLHNKKGTTILPLLRWHSLIHSSKEEKQLPHEELLIDLPSLTRGVYPT